jgi:hypothetical protein
LAVHVLSIGINDYIGTENDLHQCVADAQGFSSLFKTKPYLLDQQATRSNIIQAVPKFVGLAGPGDWYVGHYSGHGSQVPDRNRDELDGKDEVIVAADLKYIIDDEFPGLIANRNPQAKILQVFDSCFSGDMTRAFSFPKIISDSDTGKARFIDPTHLDDAPRRKATLNRYTSPFLPGVIVMSACADFELSYESSSGGVFTSALRQAYKPTFTIGQWFVSACILIQKSQFGSKQHPQINCHPSCLSWPVPVA